MFAERVAGAAQAPAWERAAAWAEARWERLALAAVLALSAVLEFWRIGASGYPNTYYAAGVRSMLESWHNLFFNSFDPAGFVTIDKPPLGFWLQALSAEIFGFHSWSILLPEAVAGVLSVLLLYHLVARVWGAPAGLLAALALALAPINVVTDRSNVVDGLLVLTVLLAAWAVTRAVETGGTRWLVLGALIVGLGFNVKMLEAYLVGLGFNVKMLEAYLVVPALGLMYLVGARAPWRRRVWQLVLATAVLAAVSASWITIVDATPASSRPYVGSTTTNSEWDLAIGYNGLQRLNGRTGGGFGRGAPPGAPPPPGTRESTATLRGFTQGENGSPGVTRLFNQEIGTQVSWLLPLAILGLIVAAADTRRRFPLDARQSSLVLWGAWGLVQGVFFSKAQFFHVYYMVMMTPAICALFGIGIAVLWRHFRGRGWTRFLLPLGLAATAAVQIAMIRNTPNGLDGLVPAIVVAVAIVVAALLAVQLVRMRRTMIPAAAVAAGLVLLIGPGVWSQNAVASGGNGLLPGAQFGRGGGPPGAAGTRAAAERDRFRGAFRGGDASVDPKVIRYLDAHASGYRYYVAAQSSMQVAPIIIATGKRAIALGGFSGGDPIVDAAGVQRMVRSGQIRYFLLQTFRGDFPGGGFFGRGGEVPPPQGRRGFGGFGRGENSAVTRWVSSHCTAVPRSEWQSATVAPSPGGFGRGERFGGETLYDCAPKA